MSEQRKLYRSREDRVIAGVCGGLGEYFGIDPVFVRLIALVLLFAGGSAFVIYLVMAIIVPENPLDADAPRGAEGANAGAGADDSATPVSSAQSASADSPSAATPSASQAHPQPASKAARQGGMALGLLLIGIGLAFLVGRFVPGVAWWTLWPLIIVFVGGVQCVTPGHEGWSIERFLDGAGTIVVGLVLLGNVLGLISWSVWWVLLTLWPVLLVSLGLSLLAKGLGQTWLRVAGSLVVLAAFVYAASVSMVGTGALSPATPWVITTGGHAYATSEPLDGVTEAALKLKSGGASIDLRSGGELLSLSGRSSSAEPTLEVKRSGVTAEVLVDSSAQGTVVMGPGIVGEQMQLALGTAPAWDIDLSTGATSLSADLSEVALSGFTLSSGVSSCNLRLGMPTAGSGMVPVVAKSGIGVIDIAVPEGVEARLDLASGLTGTSVGGRFEKVGDYWETPGYSSADTGYDIRVESGIGSIAVTTY